MPTAFENLTKRITRDSMMAANTNRTMLLSYSSQMSQSAAGQVVSLDIERRSAKIQLQDGSTQEHFLQNRYVQRGSSVGAIGQRIL